MSGTNYKIWCILDLEGDKQPFFVNALSTTAVHSLKDLITAEDMALRAVSIGDLTLWKPTEPILVKPSNTLAKRLRDMRSDISTFAELLDPVDSVGQIFQDRNQTSTSPQLDVIIRLPAHMRSPTLVGEIGVMQSIPRPDDLQEYSDIFVKIGDWRKFEHSDVSRNNILDAQDRRIGAPTFVTTFEQMLERKPRCPLDYAGLSKCDIESSFEPFSATTDEGTRDANQVELIHAVYVAGLELERRWKVEGAHRHPLKEYVAKSSFFDIFELAPMSGTNATLTNEKCPIYVILECRTERRQYQPRSDFLFSNSDLPRLLVEVNSTSTNRWPKDLVRMLTTGAFIVRFANQFVNPFKEKRTFVLCALFIWDDGSVTRCILFQKENDRKVYYNKKILSLNQSSGRLQFIRHFYNLLSVNSDEEEDTSTAVARLNGKIQQCNLKSMYSNEGTDTADDGSEGGGGRGNRAGGSGETDDTQLRAHGYKVRQQDIVDDSGNVMELLYKMPDNLRVVYRPSNPDEEFVAKEVRQRSNELDILRHLDTIERKSDHVVTLIDSFDGWVVLPKLVTVMDRIRTAPKQFESKIVQVCWGLVEGVGYLHGLCIAHRDIKPDNLVVDRDWCLKIIDFDIAMKVEDEDQQVDGQRGTKGWMAPEVEKKSRHSPIRADRWACGQVLLCLLNEFKNEDKSLRVLARHLIAYDPKQRPSLIGASSVTPPLFSDAGNGCSASKRKALQPSQDSTEDEGGNVEPPNTKKQKLHGVGIQAA